MKKLVAEFIGTFWLVFGGCGSALLACNFPGNGIAYVGVAWAFGLTVVTMAYAFGHISGAHLNPAVSIGTWVAGRLETKNLLPYIMAQVLGGIAAAALLYVISTGNGSEIGNFAINGYEENSPGHYSMLAALITEIVLTFIFLLVILGSTDERAPKGFAGLAIGMCLTLIHLISIPVTNTSVNPARSTSQAIFVGGEAISQLWLFWLAPIVGAILAGIVYKCFFAIKD
jgi:aquaporin Z